MLNTQGLPPPDYRPLLHDPTPPLTLISREFLSLVPMATVYRPIPIDRPARYRYPYQNAINYDRPYSFLLLSERSNFALPVQTIGLHCLAVQATIGLHCL